MGCIGSASFVCIPLQVEAGDGVAALALKILLEGRRSENNNAHRGRRSGGRYMVWSATGRRRVADRIAMALGGGEGHSRNSEIR